MNDRTALWLYRAGVVVFGLALCVLLWGIARSAGAQDTVGEVCAPGNVKYEVGTGYEYTDNTATLSVTDDARRVDWQPRALSVITQVCVKIGGPGGGALVYPDPAAGWWASESYAISHVVLTTERPTAVTVTDLRGASTDPLALACLGVTVLLFLAVRCWIIGED